MHKIELNNLSTYIDETIRVMIWPLRKLAISGNLCFVIFANMYTTMSQLLLMIVLLIKTIFFNEILITNAKCFCQNKSSNLNHDSCDTFFPKRCYLPVETH